MVETVFASGYDFSTHGGVVIILVTVELDGDYASVRLAVFDGPRVCRHSMCQDAISEE